MGPEQVLSNSLNWHPCSEPAELWVSLWVFQPADCGIRLLPDPSRSVSLQQAHLGGKRSHIHCEFRAWVVTDEVRRRSDVPGHGHSARGPLSAESGHLSLRRPRTAVLRMH